MEIPKMKHFTTFRIPISQSFRVILLTLFYLTLAADISLSQETGKMTNSQNYPNFVSTTTSPTLTDPGVAIKLVEGGNGYAFQSGEPVILNGMYGADKNALVATEGQPLTGIMIIILRRDQPGGWLRTIVDPSVMPPSMPLSASSIASDFIDYGYFNANLTSLPNLSLGPGNYLVAVSLLGALSSWENFKIVEKSHGN